MNERVSQPIKSTPELTRLVNELKEFCAQSGIKPNELTRREYGLTWKKAMPYLLLAAKESVYVDVARHGNPFVKPTQKTINYLKNSAMQIAARVPYCDDNGNNYLD